LVVFDNGRLEWNLVLLGGLFEEVDSLLEEVELVLSLACCLSHG
jgi:hypothetical protein